RACNVPGDHGRQSHPHRLLIVVLCKECGRAGTNVYENLVFVASHQDVFTADSASATFRAQHGIENENVAPGPSFGSPHKRPPCFSMMDRLIESPMPIPSLLVV